MSSARGFANHSLYMARLLVGAWRQQRDAAKAMPSAIDAAFAPAVRLHLLDAYGWFLLATVRATDLPTTPPHSVDTIPALGKGLALPAEVDEYRQLEQTAWLGRLQAPLPKGMPRPTAGNVLAISGGYPQLADYADWCEHFEALFTRISDSLDEN